MDELRRQAYQNLIDSLLTCDREEEMGIMQANLELIDEGFAQFLRQDWATQTLAKLQGGKAFNRAIVLYGLNIGFSSLGQGSRASNLEVAIACLEIGLTVFTREAYSEGWAMFQNSLGVDYRDRIRGEKAENLELAIAAYLRSLEVYNREAFPQDWAQTQNNLGIAYRDRIRGEKAENLELAIAAYLRSLEVYNREAFPFEWARSQNNLGNAYRDRIRGEKAENLELAIAVFLASLEVYNREAFPFEWARSQNNLGTAYSNRIRGKKAENLELAIAAYLASLEVYTREAFPFEWATTKNNLGAAYSNRIRGKKAENLELAIAAFWASLEVRTREAFPINNANTLYNLGLAYRDNSQLPAAYDAFNTAIETVELMRSEIIIGGEADRQKLAEEWNKLYQDMVEVCLAMANQTAALEYVERSKTRNLVELFYNARSVQQNSPPISFAKIGNLLAEDEAILEWYITPNNFKVFIVTYQPPQPPLSKGGLRIQPPLSNEGLRIQPPLSKGGLRRVDVWESSYQDLQALEEFQREYIDDIKDQEKYDNWKNQLETRLEKLAEILHIDEIISRLPESCQRLILVPFRYLHLLPLHALTSRRLRQNVEETGSLLDLFPGGVRYTPSCQLLLLSQRVNPPGEESSPRRLFAIQNPTEDLDFTDIEVEAIAKSFNPAEVLIREKASKTGLQERITGLQDADIAHFSCHGFFDFSNPRKSALILAGSKVTPLNPPLVRGETGEDFPLPSGETKEIPPLTKGGLGGVSSDKSYIRSRRGEIFDIAQCVTLTEIFDYKLNKCSLVTLSACETGLTDIRDTTDEYIGLPSGFFYAGATNVISTLWSVNDVSTAILMIKFYEILLSEIRPPVAIALRESQLWLRGVTVQKLLEWADSSKLLDSQNQERIKKRFRRGYKPEVRPFQDPLYWAAFCAVGQ